MGHSYTLGLLGPSHQLRHKSQVSVSGPSCAQGVGGTHHGEVRNRSPIKIKSYLDFKTMGFVV